MVKKNSIYEFLKLCFFHKLEKKTESKKFLASVFFKTVSPPCLGLWFFFWPLKNYKFSLYPFLTFFSTRLLETHLGGLRQPVLVLSYPKGLLISRDHEFFLLIKTIFEVKKWNFFCANIFHGTYQPRKNVIVKKKVIVIPILNLGTG